MDHAERLQHWNQWYDGLPSEWRMHVVLWPILIVGAINMIITIAVGFPFGLLVLLAIAFVAYCRVPYALGWVHHDASQPGSSPSIHLGRIDWVWRINEWYDAQPEMVRFWVVPLVLILAGTLNMLFTISVHFPFGVLFLLALLAVSFVRGTYISGWLTEPPTQSAPMLETHSAPLLHHEPQVVPSIVPSADPAEQVHAAHGEPPREMTIDTHHTDEG